MSQLLTDPKEQPQLRNEIQRLEARQLANFVNPRIHARHDRFIGTRGRTA